MISKKIGGVLLIVGTSIGAGMLALPVANASIGFWPSTVLLFVCWALMTLGALYMTEASLYVRKGQHLVSMANATLGRPGILMAWLTYVLLLYTLLSAYISGGADVLGGLLSAAGIFLPDWISTSVFTLLLGAVVYNGIHTVDKVNRLLMFVKFAIFCFLVFLIMPHTQTQYWHPRQTQFEPGLLMILITSFGFAVIVPNLRDYFEGQARVLARVILIGSLIPLVCYLLWDAVIMGSIPSEGSHSLVFLQKSAHTTSLLATFLSQQVQSPLIHRLFNCFTSICMLTAFLGVSLGLMSFLADAFKLSASGKEGAFLFFITFFPAWCVVMFYPGAYMYALSYAGTCSVLLLVFLPALMCLSGRRSAQVSWQVLGGSLPIYFTIAAGALLFVFSFF